VTSWARVKSRLPRILLCRGQGSTSCRRCSNLDGATTLPTTLSGLFSRLAGQHKYVKSAIAATARQCSANTAAHRHPCCRSSPPSAPLSTIDTAPHSPLLLDHDGESACPSILEVGPFILRRRRIRFWLRRQQLFTWRCPRGWPAPLSAINYRILLRTGRFPQVSRRHGLHRQSPHRNVLLMAHGSLMLAFLSHAYHQWGLTFVLTNSFWNDLIKFVAQDLASSVAQEVY